MARNSDGYRGRSDGVDMAPLYIRLTQPRIRGDAWKSLILFLVLMLGASIGAGLLMHFTRIIEIIGILYDWVFPV